MQDTASCKIQHHASYPSLRM